MIKHLYLGGAKGARGSKVRPTIVINSNGQLQANSGISCQPIPVLAGSQFAD